MSLHGDAIKNDVERPANDPALATDLIKSMAVSSAELWNDVLQRLTELQASQVLLAQAVAEIGAVVHEGLGRGAKAELPAAVMTPTVVAALPAATSPLSQPIGLPGAADAAAPSQHARPNRAERRASIKAERAETRAAKDATKSESQATENAAKHGAVTETPVVEIETPDAPTKKRPLLKRDLSFGRRRGAAKVSAAKTATSEEPEEASAKDSTGVVSTDALGALDLLEYYVMDDPGVYVEPVDEVLLPPPPMVTPPPPVIPPPPAAADLPVTELIEVPSMPVPPQPLVYTPNRSANQFDVSALDHVNNEELVPVTEPMPAPVETVYADARPVESSASMVTEILSSAPAVAVLASPGEPRPLVISEDLTLVSKSRKRRTLLRIR